MRTTIVKWGNSQGIRLPKLLLDSVNLADNDAVEVNAVDGQIVITKASGQKPRKSIQELFAGYDGGFLESREQDWGAPQGDEAW